MCNERCWRGAARLHDRANRQGLIAGVAFPKRASIVALDWVRAWAQRVEHRKGAGRRASGANRLSVVLS